MREIIKIPKNMIIPEKRDILKLQGIPLEKSINSRTDRLINDSITLLKDLISPVAIIEEITIDEFKDVFEMRDSSVVKDLYSRSDRLALTVLTLGRDISDRIGSLFKSNDFAFASILDSAASAGAEKGSEFIENFFCGKLNSGTDRTDIRVLLYSPGYCGWNITSQREIFTYLKPERIGVKLNSSFLMDPIKSVSGLLIAGKRDIHILKNDYSFCNDCLDRSCRTRIANLK